MKLTPREHAIYTLGRCDGERAMSPRSALHTGNDRLIYERGYGRGYDARYREDMARRQHGNKRDDARAAR